MLFQPKNHIPVFSKYCPPTTLLVVILSLFIHSCTIEKRRYLSGFHIEKRHTGNRDFSQTEPTPVHLENDQKSEEPNDEIFLSRCDSVSFNTSIHTDKPSSSTSSDIVVTSDQNRFSRKAVFQTINLIKEISIPSAKSNSTDLEIGFNSKRGSNVHPDSFTSFLCGLAAFGCLAAVFLTGASPLALFIGLLLAMLFFAFLAGRLANRAFRDMHYARDRYSGKALAVAGLVMGVLSIVAFIGLILIVLLGFAFISLT